MSITSTDSSYSKQPVNKITEGIYQIRIPLSVDPAFTMDNLNAYLIEGKAGWLMIDTGWYLPVSFSVLEAALQYLEVKFSDIRTIVITHCHPDHYGMAGKIKEKSPEIKILCHRWEADLIESRYINFSEPRQDIAFLLEKHGVPENEIPSLGDASMPILKRVAVASPSQMLYGGEMLHTGIFDLEVIWTPGHSPGHICLYEPKNRLLFCGDHILPTISPNIGYHVFSGDDPLGDFIHSLDKLAYLQVQSVLPGHESPFTDLQGRIKSIKDHHYQREVEIRTLLERKIHNSYQIARQLTWSVNLPWEQFPPLQKRFAITETIAHLERMRWEGKVVRTIEDKHIAYEPIPGR